MESWQVFAKAHEMYALGATFLSLVLQGTDCTPLAGYAFFNEKFEMTSSSFPTPIGRRTAMTLAINAPGYNHAVGVLFNNEERTFSFLDSSFEEEHKNPQRVIALLKAAYPTYTYVSVACPRNILPQKDDSYCTMWSYFLLTKSCRGFVLREYLRNRSREQIQREFMQFIDELYAKFIDSQLYILYTYYQQTFLGLYLSKQHIHAAVLDNKFRSAPDQKQLLDEYQQYITRPTQVRRTYNQARFLTDILTFSSQLFPSHTDQLLADLTNITDINDIVETLTPMHDGRYLLTEILHFQSQLIESGISAPVLMSLYNRYYLPYKQRILQAITEAKVDPNEQYAIASTLKHNKSALVAYYIYPMLAGMTVEEYEKARITQRSRITKDTDLLQQYLFYVTNGGEQSEFIFGRITGNEMLPLPDDAVPIRRHPYIEMLFLYHMTPMFRGRDFLEYVNIENINNIEGGLVTKSDIVYALTNSLDTLGIKHDEYHRIPQELRSLYIRYYLPAQQRLFEFLVLTGLKVDNMSDLYVVLEEKVGFEKLEELDLESMILYGDDPIEKLVHEYLGNVAGAD